MKQNNEAFLMKLAFNMVKEKDALWVRVLRNKYGCGESTIPIVSKIKGVSNVWKGITRVWSNVLSSLSVNQNRDEEVIKWNSTADGQFTVRSAYRQQGNQATNNGIDLCRTIWKWKGPERIKTFI